MGPIHSFAYLLVLLALKGACGSQCILRQKCSFDSWGSDPKPAIVHCTKVITASDSIPSLSLTGHRNVSDDDDEDYVEGSSYLDYYEERYRYHRECDLLHIKSSTIPSITNKTFTNYHSVTSLDIRSNRIEDIVPGAFDQLQRLQTLDISGNYIKHIKEHTFDSLHKLKFLSLEDNYISTIDASAFPQTPIKLYLRGNQLTNMSNSLPDSLRFLDLSRNRLNKTLSVNQSYIISWYSVIKLSMNHLEGFEYIGAHVYITDLDLSYNNLSHVESLRIDERAQLQKLNLSHNSLTVIGRNSFNPNLNILELQDNSIVEIQPDAFRDYEELRAIDLSRNNLTNLPGGLFDPLHSLQSLRLSGNKLKDFKYNIINGFYLWDLDLSKNQLETIQLSDGEVNHIDLSNNRLKKFENCSEVRVNILNLAHNYVEEMIAVKLENRELYLNHNYIRKLTSFDDSRIKTLRHLNLNHNSIETIDDDYFATFLNLQQLDLAHNKLTSIGLKTFHKLEALTDLDLSSNMLTAFQRGTFYALRKLEMLNLAHNRLTSLHFVDLPGENLGKLYLANNSLTSFNYDDYQSIQFHLKRLTVLSLHENQLSCSELNKVYRYLNTYRIDLMKGDARDVENVHGIACGEKSKVIANTIPSTEVQIPTENNSDFYFKFFEQYFANEHSDVITIEQKVNKSVNTQSGTLKTVTLITSIIIMCGICILICCTWLRFVKNRRHTAESLEMEL